MKEAWRPELPWALARASDLPTESAIRTEDEDTVAPVIRNEDTSIRQDSPTRNTREFDPGPGRAEGKVEGPFRGCDMVEWSDLHYDHTSRVRDRDVWTLAHRLIPTSDER